MKSKLAYALIFTLLFLIPVCVNAETMTDEEMMLEAVETLRHGDNDDYIFAMVGLYEFGPEAIKVLPELVEIVGGAGEGHLTYPNIYLGATSGIILESEEPEFGEKSNRFLTATVIKVIWEDATPLLIDYLDSEDPVMRAGAAYVITEISNRPTDFMQKIYPMFYSDDPLLRITAAQVVSRLKVDHYSSVPLLKDLLKDKVPQVRAHAVNGLTFFRDECDVFEPIRGMLDDEVPAVRAVAVRMLSLLENRREDVAPVVIEYLNDENEIVRRTAVNAISLVGPAAKDAVPLLIRELQENTLGFSDFSVIWALGSIGPDAKDAVPLLIALLESDEFAIPEEAARALGYIGVASDDVISGLIKLLDEDWLSDRDQAVLALGRLGPAASDALPKLRELAADDPFRNPDKEVWDVEKKLFVYYAFALSSIDPESNEGLPILVAAIENEQGYIRNRAILKLGDLGVIADDVVPILINLLHSEESSDRYSAASALAKIGPAASDALPKLWELAMNDPSWDDMRNDYDVRVEARKAIEKIEGNE